MLASGTDIKETIVRQYDEIISIFDNSGKLPASLCEAVDKHHKRLVEKRKEFSEELCQVVVSGKKIKRDKTEIFTNKMFYKLCSKYVSPRTNISICHWIKHVKR